MPIGPTQSLVGLTIHELYSVYVAVTRADHRHRMTARYGTQGPPNGHATLRQLTPKHFEDLLTMARRLAGGEQEFLGGLSRQASAYGVDVPAEIAKQRRAAA